jgi:hypothetical protein
VNFETVHPLQRFQDTESDGSVTAKDNDVVAGLGQGSRSTGQDFISGNAAFRMGDDLPRQGRESLLAFRTS